MTAVCDTTREHIGCLHRVVTLVTDKVVVILGIGASLGKLGVESCKQD